MAADGQRPRGWTVIGSGSLADSVRAEIERDPDRYAPETWSIEPKGICPCCDQEVFRCKTRHTGWSEGFATHANVVHPRCDATTNLPDPNGTEVGCCCVAPNFGPKHQAELKKSRSRSGYEAKKKRRGAKRSKPAARQP